MKADKERLLGTWRTDPDHVPSLRQYGDVSLRFEDDAKLVFTAHLPDKQQIIHMTYHVEGTQLITDQESSPRKDHVEFFFTADGRLAIVRDGPAGEAFFVRV